MFSNLLGQNLLRGKNNFSLGEWRMSPSRTYVSNYHWLIRNHVALASSNVSHAGKNSVMLTTRGKMHEICSLCLFFSWGCIMKLVLSGNGFPFLHKNVGTIIMNTWSFHFCAVSSRDCSQKMYSNCSWQKSYFFSLLSPCCRARHRRRHREREKQQRSEETPVKKESPRRAKKR